MATRNTPQPTLLVSKLDGSILARYPSMVAAAKAAGVDVSIVSNSCRCRTLTANSYYWRSAEGVPEDARALTEYWDGRDNRPIIVLQPEVKTATWCANVAEAADLACVVACVVSDHLTRRRGMPTRNGEVFMRLDGTDEWPLMREKLLEADWAVVEPDDRSGEDGEA